MLHFDEIDDDDTCTTCCMVHSYQCQAKLPASKMPTVHIVSLQRLLHRWAMTNAHMCFSVTIMCRSGHRHTHTRAHSGACRRWSMTTCGLNVMIKHMCGLSMCIDRHNVYGEPEPTRVYASQFFERKNEIMTEAQRHWSSSKWMECRKLPNDFFYRRRCLSHLILLYFPVFRTLTESISFLLRHKKWEWMMARKETMAFARCAQREFRFVRFVRFL